DLVDVDVVGGRVRGDLVERAEEGGLRYPHAEREPGAYRRIKALGAGAPVACVTIALDTDADDAHSDGLRLEPPVGIQVELIADAVAGDLGGGGAEEDGDRIVRALGHGGGVDAVRHDDVLFEVRAEQDVAAQPVRGAFVDGRAGGGRIEGGAN